MVFGLRLGLPKRTQAEPAPAQAESTGKAEAGEGAKSSVKTALTVNEFVARTKRRRERGQEPTKPELIAYARYLGIDPVVDGDLMWIADEALSAPLPSEWTEHHDNADRVFYYNVQTQASSWTHPLEQPHRDIYKLIVNFRSGNLSKEDQHTELEKLRNECEEAERAAHNELQLWTDHMDEQGQKFFYNREQQRSVWTDPRPALCHTLYLRMKALRVLGKHSGQPNSARGNGQLSTLLGRTPRQASNQTTPVAATASAGDKLKLMQRRTQQAPRDEELSSEEELKDVDRSEDRKKKKKKEKKDRKDKEPRDSGGNKLDAVSGGSNFSPRPAAAVAGDNSLTRLPLEVKKPLPAAVEEVRQALGVVGPGGGMGPHRRHLAGLDGNRIPSPPPGDGLSTQGRARVRAGIRLEPIRGAG